MFESRSRPAASGVVEVFNANGNSVKRTFPPAGVYLRLGLLRDGARVIVKDGDERVKGSIVLMDASQTRVDHVDWRDRPQTDLVVEFANRLVMNSFAHVGPPKGGHYARANSRCTGGMSPAA